MNINNNDLFHSSVSRHRSEFSGGRCCPNAMQRVYPVPEKQNQKIGLMVKQYQKICLMVKFIRLWKIKFMREVTETSQIG